MVVGQCARLAELGQLLCQVSSINSNSEMGELTM